jgi:hypothetical protein
MDSGYYRIEVITSDKEGIKFRTEDLFSDTNTFKFDITGMEALSQELTDILQNKNITEIKIEWRKYKE